MGNMCSQEKEQVNYQQTTTNRPIQGGTQKTATITVTEKNGHIKAKEEITVTQKYNIPDVPQQQQTFNQPPQQEYVRVNESITVNENNHHNHHHNKGEIDIKITEKKQVNNGFGNQPQGTVVMKEEIKITENTNNHHHHHHHNNNQFNAPPQQGFNPPPTQGFNAPPQQGFNAPPQNQGFQQPPINKPPQGNVNATISIQETKTVNTTVNQGGFNQPIQQQQNIKEEIKFTENVNGHKEQIDIKFQEQKNINQAPQQGFNVPPQQKHVEVDAEIKIKNNHGHKNEKIDIHVEENKTVNTGFNVPPQQQGFNAPPQQQGFNAPPQQKHVEVDSEIKIKNNHGHKNEKIDIHVEENKTVNTGFNAPPQQQGFNAPPQQKHVEVDAEIKIKDKHGHKKEKIDIHVEENKTVNTGFNAPPQQQGFNAPPQQQGFNAPPQQKHVEVDAEIQIKDKHGHKKEKIDIHVEENKTVNTGFNAPPQQQGFNAPPQQKHVEVDAEIKIKDKHGHKKEKIDIHVEENKTVNTGFNAPPQQQGFNAPPQQKHVEVDAEIKIKDKHGHKKEKIDIHVEENKKVNTGFNAPPQQQGFNAPPQQQGFNAPPQQQGFNAPPQQKHVEVDAEIKIKNNHGHKNEKIDIHVEENKTVNTGFNAPPQQQGFNAPPQQKHVEVDAEIKIKEKHGHKKEKIDIHVEENKTVNTGFNAPPQQQGFNAPPQQQGFNAPPQQKHVEVDAEIKIKEKHGHKKEKIDIHVQENKTVNNGFNAPPQQQGFNAPPQKNHINSVSVQKTEELKIKGKHGNEVDIKLKEKKTIDSHGHVHKEEVLDIQKKKKHHLF